MAQNKKEKARESYQKAAQLAPDYQEFQFWQAVTLADTGNLDDALPLFKVLFEKNPAWADLLQRLPASGLFNNDKLIMKAILDQSMK